MAHPSLDTALRVKAWEQKGINKLVTQSLFYQLSNYADTTKPMANPKDFAKLPPSVMLTLSDKLEMGKTSVTVPWFDELKGAFRGGNMKEEGNEEGRSIKPFTLNYNLFRKSTPVSDDSVDSDAQEYWQLASKAKDSLYTYLGKMVDFCAQRALVEGGDILLTDSTYWTGSTFSSAPVTVAIHPKVFVDSASDFVTWNNTYATYESAIESAAGAMSVSNTMTVAKVARIANIASRKVSPLGWSYKGQAVNWILKISPIQAYQLSQDATAVSGFVARAGAAEDRGMDNRALTGIIGVWFGVLVIEDQRAPIYTHAATSGTRFGYYRPDYSINAEPTRTAHGSGAATGTCEIAMLLGDKAIANAMPMLPNIVKKDSTDYNFSKDMAIRAKMGFQRPDFRGTGVTTQPTNESSFLYLTATPSDVYLG